jgi:peptide-methionine (S)-S-oxide reductase
MNKTSEIVFGGGCFWCTEAVFDMLKGVSSVVPGYSGGQKENPTYEEVSSGDTGHAEVVKIAYDDNIVKTEDLLTVFFGSHDPTTLNRQGADVGTQYRSVVYYTNEEQKNATKKFIEEINASNEKGEKIVTEVLPLDKFYEAEDYHKNYFQRNGDTNPYCEIVINPKLEKVQKKYTELLKN